MLLDTSDAEKLFCTVSFLTGPDFRDILTAQGIFDNMVITGGIGCFYGISGTISGSVLEVGFQYDLNLDDPDSASDISCSTGLFDEPWTEPFGDVFIDYLGDGEFTGVSSCCLTFCNPPFLRLNQICHQTFMLS